MGLLRDYLDRKFQRETADYQQDHASRQFMAKTLLDAAENPDLTETEHANLYSQVQSLIGGAKKQPKQDNPASALLGFLFHHDHVKTPTGSGVQGQSLYSDEQMNTQVPVGEVQSRPTGDPTQTIQPKPLLDLPLLKKEAPASYTPTEVYQPTKRFGDTTPNERGEQRVRDRFNFEQNLKAQLDAQDDERTRQRMVEVEKIKSAERVKVAEAKNEQAFALIDHRYQAQAGVEYNRIKSALVAKGVPADEAATQAGDLVVKKYQSGIDTAQARAANLRAMTAAIPERLRLMGEGNAIRWGMLDVADVNSQQGFLSIMNNWERLNQDEQRQIDGLMFHAAELDKQAADSFGNPDEIANIHKQAQALRDRATGIAGMIQTRGGNVPQRPTTRVPQAGVRRATGPDRVQPKGKISIRKFREQNPQFKDDASAAEAIRNLQYIPYE